MLGINQKLKSKFMEQNIYTDENFISFYFALKNDFKSVKLTNENWTKHSSGIDHKIDFYFEKIFGQRTNSNLYDYYNSVYYKIKDVVERNNKTILKTVNDFYYRFDLIFEIGEFKITYFLKDSLLEKHLGFQKDDRKFNDFLTTLILNNIIFENGDFTILDDSYETIINEFINKSIKNIRYEIAKNDIKIVSTEILKDINKLEILKIEEKFEFLDESIKSLRLLKADLDSLNTNTKQSLIDFPLQNNFENIEKKDTKLKIEILFSPTKFRNLLIVFFKNAGIEMDEDKENRIDRFILNVIKFDKKKYTTFTGSPSEVTINFFNKKEAKILKFCALLFFLMKNDKMSEINVEPLQNILIAELKELNLRNIGIGTNLRNQIRNKLNSMPKENLAKFAGYTNTQEILRILKR